MFLGFTKFIYDCFKYEDEKFYYLSLIKESEYDEYPYTIHGFWPQYSKTSYPTYCKNLNFSLDALKPILDELNKYWSSNKGKDENPDFWKHEYLKHGSCMFTDVSEFDYFNKTINLYLQALQLNLPDKYYDPKTGKCLIPVNLDFTFKN